MLTHIVKHTCGHEAPHGFSGHEPERRRREEWLRRQPCQACWRAEQARSAEVQRGQSNLPALEGADEQNTWAEVIRMKAIAHNRDYCKRLLESRKFNDEDEAMKIAIRGAADDALRELENQRSAEWWIANRFSSLSCVKQRIVAAVTPILNARAER
ncbi:MAG: hypothetical protein HZB26_15015 [Candidatus Hydrogenedentes bacterium]|nr:hypothetical protein [Candidatus Hydrogenedentota bacterium]